MGLLFVVLSGFFYKNGHENCSFFLYIIILCKPVCFKRSCECSLLVKSFASTCGGSVFESTPMFFFKNNNFFIV